MTPAAPHLLTVAEVARILRRRPTSVHRIIRSGRLGVEVVDFAGTRHVRRADLEAFLGAPITAADLQAVAS